VFITDERRRSLAGLEGLARVPLGLHFFGSEAMAVRESWALLSDAKGRHVRGQFAAFFPELLAATSGGRPELGELVDPSFHDLIDDRADSQPRFSFAYQSVSNRSWGIDLGTWHSTLRVYAASGQVAGYVWISKPAAGMSILGTMASGGDLRHLERIQDVVTADRRPAAILFADLDASSPLARRLATADYFTLARALVRAADQCVVDAGGLVGRHLGDGVRSSSRRPSVRNPRPPALRSTQPAHSETPPPTSPNAAVSHQTTRCCASDRTGARRSTSD
jgi:hypothetical protein